MPGNPIGFLLYYYVEEQGYTMAEALDMVRHLYGIMPTDPLWVQYINYIENLIRGNLGISYVWGVPVREIIVKSVPWTVFLISTALLISFSLGVVLGMFMAYRRGSTFDNLANVFASVSNATPDYIIGFLVVLIFSIRLGLFPSGGNYSRGTNLYTLEGIVDLLYHSFLPIMAYVISTIGGWMLLMRGCTMDVLGEDYITVAEARGLRKSRIALAYVGRNAMLPLITRLTISLGSIFGGSVFIETLFSYPGIGWFLSFSLRSRDYTLMQGCFLLITIAVVVANFIADILYSILDPRIRIR